MYRPRIRFSILAGESYSRRGEGGGEWQGGPLWSPARSPNGRKPRSHQQKGPDIKRAPGAGILPLGALLPHTSASKTRNPGRASL